MNYFFPFILFIFASQAFGNSTLRILNWSDYIDQEVLAQFTETTGIALEIENFDTEDEFLASFFSASEPFDIIVPTDNLLAFLISRNSLSRLDRNQLKNYSNFDSFIMKQLAVKDPSNVFSVPYLWGTTGIGINKQVAPSNAIELIISLGWQVLFDPDVRSQFSQCGIAAVYERDELFAAALKYAGYSINTNDSAELAKATELLTGLLKDIKYLHSLRYAEELASGKICIALGYSGDVAAAGFESDAEIAYIIPIQGASMWLDVLAIPANSKNKRAAHRFIDFLSNPEVAAKNSNHNAYPNAVLGSEYFIDADLLVNDSLFPSINTIALLETFSIPERRNSRQKKKLWVKATCSGSGLCEVPIDYGY